MQPYEEEIMGLGFTIKRRQFVAGGAALLAGAAFMGVARAQDDEQSDERRVDDSFSNTIISQMGYPEITITVGPSGVTAPSVLEAGYYYITLTPERPEHMGYVDFVQPPAGLDEETERALMLDAGRNDLVQPDWVYAGGSNSPNPGESANFIIYLAPGDYKIAASYYEATENAEEIMTLVPLAVAEPATPSAQSEPASTVLLEETDELRYIVTPGEIPAGPNVWKIANTGMHHTHHMVMARVPDDLTAEEIIRDFTSLMLGTPGPRPDWMTSGEGFGYAAVQSGGQTTWAEFDLVPGNYALICYIMEPDVFRPHLMDGMVTTFIVTE
jgi:hypothetical protein